MAKKHQFPLIYHPTNVLFLDDEKIYLDRITQSLDDRIAYIKMTDPNAAFDYLKKRCYQPDEFSAMMTDPNVEQYSGSESTKTFDVDFSKWLSQLDSADRFQKVTVMFVDQVMAKMQGLKFCEKVRDANLPVKLILLTGNTEEDAVIRAFNDGLIDYYLPKNDPNLSKKISEQAVRYSWEQFIDLSQPVMGFASSSLKPLQEKGFWPFFDSLLKERDCHEFYLLDNEGSFLLLNDAGQGSLLKLHQEEDFQYYSEMAENSDAASDILERIKAKKQAPIKPLRDNYLSFEGAEWEKAMHNCHPIKEGSDVYYSLVDEPELKAFGFKRYMGEIWLKP